MNTTWIIILFFIGGGAVVSFVYQLILRKRDKITADLTLSNRSLTAEKELLERQLAQAKEDAANQLAVAKKEALEQMAQNEDRAARQLKEQMEALKLAFGEAANKIFEEKTKGLSESNEKGIKTILDPLKEKMEEFKKEVMETKEKSIKTNASLEEQIKSMMDKASSLGKEANNLASALKGSNKIQGNWGESHLEKLLQDAGFVEGVDYSRQETVRASSGEAIRNEETDSKLVPDIILTFPDNKVVVIDSKVSLSAYLDYCDGDASAEQTADALRRHLESVRTHIKELSRKDYASALKKSEKDSLKYCIMYVPNEMAFQLFFSEHQDEWRDAFDHKGVIVVGDLYLITMLKIIRLTWDAHIREKNTEKITQTASELLNRVGDFIKTFEGIGANITKMSKSYDDARSKLFGRISIATTSRKLGALGIESKKPIAEGHLLVEDVEDE